VHLFLMLSVPLAYVYLLIVRDEANQPAAMTSLSALKGAIAYLIVLIPLLAIDRFAERPFSGPGLYFFGTVYDFAIPGLFGFLLYLWFTSDPGGLTPEERFLSLTSFFAGLFTVAGFMDLFVRPEYFGSYELFLLPALRISLMLMLPVLFYFYAAETLWLRYAYLVLLAATPFALGTVPMLSLLNYPFAAIAVTLVLFLGSIAAALFAVGGRRSLRLR
jgi:hypothetical protein